MPCTPKACSADFTSSSLKGLITAVMSFIQRTSQGALPGPHPLPAAFPPPSRSVSGP
jgi:hypothetical protein